MSTLHLLYLRVFVQLQQAQSNQFDHHVHVEYEWRLRHDDLYDSDDDFDDKVTMANEGLLIYLLYWEMQFLCFVCFDIFPFLCRFRAFFFLFDSIYFGFFGEYLCLCA